MSKVQKLKRLKSRLAGESDASVQTPFEIRCDCGEIVRGVRRATAIQKDCDKCGEWLYVLPANVYPATKAVHSEVIDGGFVKRLTVLITEFFPAKEKPEETKQKADTPDSRKKSKEIAETEEAVSAEPAKQRWTFTLPNLNPRQLLRRIFTPFRLVMLSIVAIVGLTALWLSNKQATEEAQQVWLTTPDMIEEHVSSEDYVGLEVVLDKAVAAGEQLGKTDPEWRRIKNFRNEVAAANQLSTTDLLTVFQSAYDQQNQLLPSAAESTSNNLTGYFIFDTIFSDAYNDPDALQCDLPAAPGRHPVNCIIKLPALNDFLATVDDGRIVFAAKFSSVSSPASSQIWNLEIAAESFAFITSKELCEAVGLSVLDDPDLAQILERQEQFVRTSGTWDARFDNKTETEQ